jgi:hypothetical protein
MHRFLRLLLLIPLVCLLAAPARSEVFMDYTFPDGVLWDVGGFEVYDILQRGEIVGTARVDYSEITMMDQPAYRLRWTQSWTAADKEYETTIDSKMLGADLSVVMSNRSDQVGDEETRYEGNFSGENLTIGIYFPDDAERYEYSMNRTGDYRDAGILPFLFRNIPFADRNFVTFTVIDLVSQSFYTPIATVTGSEVVETPTTQYDCWVVGISRPEGGLTAWYSKSDNHYLVKIRDGDREIVLNHHS